MKRSWLLWSGFWLCLAVVLAALGWVSAAVARLDRAEALARRLAQHEENVRLALWRMDSAAAPLVARESARPHFAYRTFLPANHAFGRAMSGKSRPDALVPSPLLGELPPLVLAYFQFEPDGQLTSPRSPVGATRGLAVPRYLSAAAADEARALLARIERAADRQHLAARLPESLPPPVEMVLAPSARYPSADRAGQRRPSEAPATAQAAQPPGSSFEYSQRSQAFAQNTAAILQAQTLGAPGMPLLSPTDLGGVLMTPLWLGDDLVLARRVMADGQEYVQGCLLDWPAIKAGLLEQVADLLPDADLAPALSASEGQGHLLAALPVRLISVPGPDESGISSPTRLMLAIAWACVLVAAAAVAALLCGVLRLSERRAAFVSAVTHELRTPLTTFHMYTEMLSEGMVRDPQQQETYLSTLRAEASRLSHLVENVLAYARLERGRSNGRVDEVPLDCLLDPIRQRLVDRASQAGMEMVFEAGDEALATTVRTNPSAVEQILFNLVDNACKYAAGAADKRIHLSAERSGGAVRLGVRDHGPGLSRAAARRLFRPFSKSAHEAAHTAPGIGLGLALCDRLARDMGARLSLERDTAEGASFVLILPVGSPRTESWRRKP
ncbi:MAG: HAMP domain-containing histidine kinase, partial [Thermoguttaceae bacterium]|nr:HAMP domain-containing histidine kinase [Thermoguttaceae bacterium]